VCDILKSKLRYSVVKSLPPASVQNQINPGHTHTRIHTHTIYIRFNLMLCRLCVCNLGISDFVQRLAAGSWQHGSEALNSKYHTLRLEECLCTTLKWAVPEVAVNKLSNIKLFSRWRRSKQPYLLISTESVVPASTVLREYLWDKTSRDHKDCNQKCEGNRDLGDIYVDENMNYILIYIRVS